jgi:hypothetical protein
MTTAVRSGVLFIITFLTSIPALLLFGPALQGPDGGGPDPGTGDGCVRRGLSSISSRSRSA